MLSLSHGGAGSVVYGGMIASLLDCHAMGTAAAASERAAGRDIGERPAPRFVTASLRVEFLRPTPRRHVGRGVPLHAGRP